MEKESAAGKEVEEEEEEVDEGEESVQFLQSGQKILYCPMCGLPPEFCEFNSKKVFNKCKPWLIKNLPDLYPYLKEEEELAWPLRKDDTQNREDTQLFWLLPPTITITTTLRPLVRYQLKVVELS